MPKLKSDSIKGMGGLRPYMDSKYIEQGGYNALLRMLHHTDTAIGKHFGLTRQGGSDLRKRYLEEQKQLDSTTTSE